MNCGSNLHQNIDDCPFGDYLTDEQTKEIYKLASDNSYSSIKLIIQEFLHEFLSTQELYQICINKDNFNLCHLINASQNRPAKFNNDEEVNKLVQVMEKIMVVYHDKLFDITGIYRYARSLVCDININVEDYFPLSFIKCPTKILINGCKYHDNKNYINYVVLEKNLMKLIESKLGFLVSRYLCGFYDDMPVSAYKKISKLTDTKLIKYIIQRRLKEIVIYYWDKDTADYLIGE